MQIIGQSNLLNVSTVAPLTILAGRPFQYYTARFANNIATGQCCLDNFTTSIRRPTIR